MDAVDVPRTYGSILLGSFFAFGLSGAVSLQCVSYFKLYPHDGMPTKVLVSTVWLLDLVHSSFICASLWRYFITFLGDQTQIDYIPWTMAFTVLFTATQTFLVHCYFAQKILKASGRSWRITAPIVILAAGRLFAATVSTFEMVHLHQFSAFTKLYPGWVFTTGLSLSSGVDLLIMGWLCYYLVAIRTRIGPNSTMMIRWVDLITLYTLENGALTFFSATASLICWLTMPTNLVFLGLHFVIGKLYANSLLASLNIRQELQNLRWQAENQTHAHHRGRSNLNESSVYSESLSALTGQYEGNKLLPIPQSRSVRITVLGSTEPSSGRIERAYLRQYQPREPTILERRVESPLT